MMDGGLESSVEKLDKIIMSISLLLLIKLNIFLIY